MSNKNDVELYGKNGELINKTISNNELKPSSSTESIGSALRSLIFPDKVEEFRKEKREELIMAGIDELFEQSLRAIKAAGAQSKKSMDDTLDRKLQEIEIKGIKEKTKLFKSKILEFTKAAQLERETVSDDPAMKKAELELIDNLLKKNIMDAGKVFELENVAKMFCKSLEL